MRLKMKNSKKENFFNPPTKPTKRCKKRRAAAKRQRASCEAQLNALREAMTISTKKDETNTKSAVGLIEADVSVCPALKRMQKILSKKAPVVPEPRVNAGLTGNMPELRCHQNVDYLVKRVGGSRVTGWHLSKDTQGYILSHHSVWRTPEGMLVDVTLKECSTFFIFDEAKANEPLAQAFLNFDQHDKNTWLINNNGNIIAHFDARNSSDTHDVKSLLNIASATVVCDKKYLKTLQSSLDKADINHIAAVA